MPEKIGNFEDLDAWKLAHQVMLEVYKFVKYLPDDEKYNRVAQLKRSSSSVGANIAEGFGRYHWQENIHFCRIARGSLEETRNHIIAAKDLKQAPLKECQKLYNLCIRTRKVLNGYIRYLAKCKCGMRNEE